MDQMEKKVKHDSADSPARLASRLNHLEARLLATSGSGIGGGGEVGGSLESFARGSSGCYGGFGSVVGDMPGADGHFPHTQDREGEVVCSGLEHGDFQVMALVRFAAAFTSFFRGEKGRGGSYAFSSGPALRGQIVMCETALYRDFQEKIPGCVRHRSFLSPHGCLCRFPLGAA